MNEDFTPNQNQYKNMTPFKTWLKYQINTWGLNSFPFVESDFDDLTNYGMLMKMMKAVNDVIANENLVEQDMTNLYNAFTELQTYLFDEFADYKNEVDGEIEQFETSITNDFNTLHAYVDNYFDNLDVQEEINNKLDAMVEDGTLMELLSSYLPFITPEMFGAVGDGETDDTQAIQSAINRANQINAKLYMMNKTYLITSSLTIYSQLEIEGNNATIKTNNNIAVLKNENVTNNIYIHDLNIIGANNETYTNNNGIDLICYYSKFENLFISNCYNGIYIHSDGATGTLVENRLSNIRTSNYYLYGIFVGAFGNNKLTDGFLNNVICNANSNTNQNAMGILIGSSAGWIVDGVHVYGKNYNGISCANGYYTNISNIYIESFTNYGLAMGSTQIGCNVSNVQINHSVITNTGTAIRIEASQFLPFVTHAGNLSNIRITRGTSTSGKSIQYTGQGYFNASNVIIDGESRTLRNDCSGINFTMNGLLDSGDLIISKQKNGTVNGGIKVYKYKGFDPTNNTIDISLPDFTYNNQQAIIELTGIGGQWTSQSGLFYKGLIQVVRNNSGTIVTRIHDIDNTAFTATPTLSYDSETNVLTITLSPGTNIYGILYYDIYFPNLT